MSTITTRTAKGTALTWAEIDDNFTNLNTDKYQEGSAIGAVTPAAGTFTTLTATGTSSFGTGSAAYWSAIGGSAPNLRSTAGGTIDIGGSNNLSIRTNTTTEQLRVSHTASAVNYVQVTGAATTKATVISSQGSDSNISQVFQSKGTGAIDLAAGSSGVNISNGGTVTALTKTSGGTSYTSNPTVTISAPTTAGGVQATASVTYNLYGTSTVSGGTGYTVGDVLTFVGGTYTDVLQYTVTSVSAGVITGTSVLTPSYGIYSVLPTNPVSVTGGTGTGATFNLSWTLRSIAVNNAGSGYVEQPTVTFSGGGGSGAAAYATVGSDAVVRSLGNNMAFYTPNGQIGFRVTDYPARTSVGYWSAFGGSTTPRLRATGTGSGIIETQTGVPMQFITAASTTGSEQFRVSHTASAVNYVQVTGSATLTGAPTLSAQGSDFNISLRLSPKGTGAVALVNSAGWSGLEVTTVNSPNYFTMAGKATGSAPVLAVAGVDTNIDLALTPKGTGVVQFGSYTGTILTPTGYITIKDSGGTTRRLLVG